jgi:hypothetical protein
VSDQFYTTTWDHGREAECPTCGAHGRIDTTTSREPAFPDWIWRLPNGEAECHECALK